MQNIKNKFIDTQKNANGISLLNRIVIKNNNTGVNI